MIAKSRSSNHKNLIKELPRSQPDSAKSQQNIKMKSKLHNILCMYQSQSKLVKSSTNSYMSPPGKLKVNKTDFPVQKPAQPVRRILKQDASSFIAIFEKMNALDCDSGGLLSKKASMIVNTTNNSSEQLYLNPNSTTTQLPSDLTQILQKTRQTLEKYKALLRERDCEKESLIQEVIYWKSKYYKSQ